MYAPLLKAQDSWGEIRREKEKKGFLDQLVKFDDELKHKISNLRGDVELATPDAPYDKIEQKPAEYQKAATDAKVLAHFQGTKLTHTHTHTRARSFSFVSLRFCVNQC